MCTVPSVAATARIMPSGDNAACTGETFPVSASAVVDCPKMSNTTIMLSSLETIYALVASGERIICDGLKTPNPRFVEDSSAVVIVGEQPFVAITEALMTSTFGGSNERNCVEFGN